MAAPIGVPCLAGAFFPILSAGNIVHVGWIPLVICARRMGHYVHSCLAERRNVAGR